MIRRSPIRKRRTKPRPGRLEGETLNALRTLVYARDRGRCKNCGGRVIFNAPQEWDNSFHLAHIGAKRRHGDSPENTQSECGKCHRTYHNYGPTRTKPCPPKPKENV